MEIQKSHGEKEAANVTWFAIRTAPQREFAVAGSYDRDGKKIEGILEKKGYTVFCPIESKSQRTARKGKRKVALYPMFTGYAFVQWPFVWRELLSAPCVLGVVGREGKPAPIDDREIKKLMAMSGAAVPHRQSVNPHKALRAGESAEIMWGPLQGQIVKIAGLHGKKAKIFVKLFGIEKPAEIDVDQLEAA